MLYKKNLHYFDFEFQISPVIDMAFVNVQAGCFYDSYGTAKILKS
ncbi:hypothetical protein AGMMS50268_39700 [Spirochaetia bacterium]|nr:hypothetical protein AGMMS50268_39700 [Spirochaetia bacterium]